MTSALLVMDMQEAIVGRIADPTALIERITVAIAAARRAGMPVLYVRIAFRPGYPEASPHNKNFASFANAGDGFVDGVPATAIHSAVAPLPGDPIVLKKRVGAFTGSDLEVLVRSLGVTQLVLTGIATSGVVLSTLRHAADHDYELVVLRDGCADADDEVHRVLMDKVFPRQSDVVSVDDWVAGLVFRA